MRVITYNLEEKFGQQGLQALVGRVHDDAISLLGLRDVLPSEADDADPVLLLLHGYPGDNTKELLAEKMARNCRLYVLFISAAGVGEDDAKRQLNDRAFGFGFPVATVRNWQDHPTEITTRLERFVRKAAEPVTLVPPWELLRGPTGPQHLLACLLAALAGRPDFVPEEWKESFEEEVAALRHRGVSKELPWGSRDNAKELRAFLAEAGCIEEYRG